MAASTCFPSLASAMRSAPVVAPRPVVAAHIARVASGHITSKSTSFNGDRKRSLQIAHAAMVEEIAQTSFSSLMDSEDEYEMEGQEVIQVKNTQEVDESLKVTNLGLCQETVNALAARGITALFPIQKVVFQPASEGRDLIGRAKTGSGKTLAFALPVVESLIKENKESTEAGVKAKRGRAPRCIVLTPTRELANQVAKEFETVCPSLKVVSFYGGTSIGAQISQLERGVDVVVGTPGRVIDLIERNMLKLDKVRYAILDEADQMLDMGFEEDMERILGCVPEDRQTLLFSATLPKWVNKVARRFQKNPLIVDLVGEDNTGRLADTIRLMIMQVEQNQKMNAMMDCMTLYAGGGKTIVFVNTKARADEVYEAVNRTTPCVVLHGDIGQAQRDRGLQQFREGKFPVLVATDVAARGLDIPNVDLVVHYDIPQDNEAFLHRSGRTGRAGNKGTAIVLFTDRESRYLGSVLKATKVEKTELIGAPEPAEVMTTAARNVLTQLDKVDNGVIDFFVPAAERLLASDQPSRVLAAALASMSGFQKPPLTRSLLTYEDGLVTLRILAPRGQIDGWRSLNAVLKTVLKKAKITKDLEYSIGKIKMLENQEGGMDGAAFDLPQEDGQLLMSVAPVAEKMGIKIDKPRAIALDVADMLGGGGGGSGGYSSRRGPPRADRGSNRWEDRGRGGRDSGRGGAYGGDRRGGGAGSRGDDWWGTAPGSSGRDSGRRTGGAPMGGAGAGRRMGDSRGSRPSYQSMNDSRSSGWDMYDNSEDYFVAGSGGGKRSSGRR